MKKTLIFGITGQTGSYLAEFLLEKGYEVHGVIRRSSSFNTNRIDHIFNKLKLHYGDVTDSLSVDNIIQKIKPDEIYNLSAQSHVQISFELPYYTGQVDGLGVLNIIESARKHIPNARILQSSTSELFGGMEYNRPINGYTEESPMHPRSPYSVAKLYGFWICKNYKESYNQYIVNTICFNHSSARRGGNFVEKKIVDALVRIVKDIRSGNKPNEILTLGNLYSKRDIGYAKEYAEGMWLSLQQDNPNDYVLATNETYTIKDMVNYSLDYLGIEYYWRGEGLEEKCYQKETDLVLVSIDEKYFRPAEVDFLLGDATKAKNVLGWEAKTKLPELLKIMIDEIYA
jgi:GDPmannose 4,6-dehydratase